MMEVLAQENLKIDKSSWTPVKFGDVVFEPKENAKNIYNEDIKRVIGLEHIDSENIHLTRSGQLEETTTFSKKFAKGDVLFGRRRAYLKKASQASFSGICSGDITVFRAKDNLMPELLPFLVCNDKFFDYAVKHSAGGLSPRVKFKDLANYEFLLPSKDQQARLAELLWAMDEVIERERKVLDSLQINKNAIFDDCLYKDSRITDIHFGRKKSKYDVVKLGELLLEIQYGISESLEGTGEVPILRMNNLQSGKLELKDLKYYNPNKGELERFILKKGDVLFNRTNSFDLVGKVSLFDQDGIYSFASYLIRLKTDKSKLDSRFLNFFLNSPIGLSKIRKYRTPGVSQSNINAQNLKNIPIPLPTMKQQSKLMDDIDKVEEGESMLVTKNTYSRVLQKGIINQIF
ncbi:restriction endonuclease subunit S [Reichenbachiella sp.]|uniref:restriction endonuclease subunit S n=1 Tax=Reichenbachiella sp. TaxID=2184521 RepID=UPI003297CD1C